MEEQFRRIDRDCTGAISVDELTELLKKRLRMTEDEAQRVFMKLDHTGDRSIHYSEFLAAAVLSRTTLHRRVIREAFQKFDVDGKGFISIDDLRRVLGNEYGGTHVEDIIADVDRFKNGVIEYSDFVEALMEHLPSGDTLSDPQSAEIIRRVSRRTLGRISRIASGRNGVWMKEVP